MGKSQQGIYGAYKGRVGNVVGSVRDGAQILRIRPASVRNPRTEAQQNTRMRFSMLGKFLSNLRPAVNTGFESEAVDRVTAVNAALRENFNKAFTGTYPDLALDFSKLSLSKGELVVPTGMAVESQAGAVLSLSWKDNTLINKDVFNANAEDTLIAGIYNEDLKQGMVSYGAFRRSDAAGTVELPDSWAGHTLHVWVFYRSGAEPANIKNGYDVSATVYAGSVALQA
jgi:hypothetical protein